MTLQELLSLTLVIFMAGNLLDMGFRLKFKDAMGALRNMRFVVFSLLWGFIVGPALAFLLARTIPILPPYANGLILIGMTPCAPFLPMMVDRARGDLGYAAALMLLTSVITVVYMPIAVPLMIPGLTAGAWAIARPLVYFIVLPLLIGGALRATYRGLAERIDPYVRRVTVVDTLFMLVLCVLVFGKDFWGAIGSFAIGTQMLYYLILTLAAYWLSPGLPPSQRSVLALGMATRNLGAAFAPLLAIGGIDRRATVMVAIGAPLTVIGALLTAHWCARRATPATSGAMPATA
jgi:BASS family bile acid:Na+ symporter